ncbi:MAG: hypothetical protein V1846_02645 [Candidatus Komeilibacteria bacterium]
MDWFTKFIRRQQKKHRFCWVCSRFIPRTANAVSTFPGLRSGHHCPACGQEVSESQRKDTGYIGRVARHEAEEAQIQIWPQEPVPVRQETRRW